MEWVDIQLNIMKLKPLKQVIVLILNYLNNYLGKNTAKHLSSIFLQNRNQFNFRKIHNNINYPEYFNFYALLEPSASYTL